MTPATSHTQRTLTAHDQTATGAAAPAARPHLCPRCKVNEVDIFKFCTPCRAVRAQRQRARRKAHKELGAPFGFTRHIARSKTSRDADTLLEAIVRALRDKKSHRAYILQLIRCYPVVRNGSNPYRVLFDEIQRLNELLQKARELPKNDQCRGLF
jgi:hypothetical protein